MHNSYRPLATSRDSTAHALTARHFENLIFYGYRQRLKTLHIFLLLKKPGIAGLWLQADAASARSVLADSFAASPSSSSSPGHYIPPKISSNAC